MCQIQAFLLTSWLFLHPKTLHRTNNQESNWLKSHESTNIHIFERLCWHAWNVSGIRSLIGLSCISFCNLWVLWVVSTACETKVWIIWGNMNSVKVVHFWTITCEGQSPSQAIKQKCSSFIHFMLPHIIQVFVSHAIATTHRTQRLQDEIYDKVNRLRI